MDHSNESIEKLISNAQIVVEPNRNHREALREQVLAEFEKSQPTTSSVAWINMFQNLWRWIMARPVYRLGIPAVFLAVVASGFFVMLPAKEGFALENVIEPLLSAKRGRCQVVVQMKDKKLPPFTFDAMFHGSSHRQESNEMGMVMIMDEAQGKILSLNPKAKQAHILQQINRDPEQSMEGGFLQQMRDQLLGLNDEKRFAKRESLGEREIAEGMLIGFRIRGPGGEFDIWGDKKTGLPFSIVSNMAAFPNMEVTMTKFEFDVELDESLFSLAPPEGYEVKHETMDMSLRSEKGFLAALQQYVDINDGLYPETINLMVGIKLAKQYGDQLEGKPADEREKEVSRIRKLIAAGFSFPLQLSAKTQAVYAGKGVHRKETEKPIFWYLPEDSDKYHVIYADLRVVKTAEPPQVENVQEFARD